VFKHQEDSLLQYIWTPVGETEMFKIVADPILGLVQSRVVEMLAQKYTDTRGRTHDRLDMELPNWEHTEKNRICHYFQELL